MSTSFWILERYVGNGHFLRSRKIHKFPLFENFIVPFYRKYSEYSYIFHLLLFLAINFFFLLILLNVFFFFRFARRYCIPTHLYCEGLFIYLGRVQYHVSTENKLCDESALRRVFLISSGFFDLCSFLRGRNINCEY